MIACNGLRLLPCRAVGYVNTLSQEGRFSCYACALDCPLPLLLLPLQLMSLQYLLLHERRQILHLLLQKHHLLLPALLRLLLLPLMQCLQLPPRLQALLHQSATAAAAPALPSSGTSRHCNQPATPLHDRIPSSWLSFAIPAHHTGREGSQMEV